jgi:hypothetical protein
MSFETNALNAECQSIWAVNGATKTAAEILDFSAMLLATAVLLAWSWDWHSTATTCSE